MTDFQREIEGALEEVGTALGQTLLIWYRSRNRLSADTTEIAVDSDQISADSEDSGSTNSTFQVTWVPNMELVGSEVGIGPNTEMIQASGNILKRYFTTADTTGVTADSTVFLSDSQTPPTRSGKRTTYYGRTYRVLTVGNDPSGAYVHVNLGSAN